MITLAEKGGSRTLRGPYDPQTGFEDPFYPSLQPTQHQKSQQSQAPKVRVVVGSWTFFFVAHGQKADTSCKLDNVRSGCENQLLLLTPYRTCLFQRLSVNCPSLLHGDGNGKTGKMLVVWT